MGLQNMWQQNKGWPAASWNNENKAKPKPSGPVTKSAAPATKNTAGGGATSVTKEMAPSTVWLGGVSGSVSTDEVKELFALAGTVTNVHFLKPGTGFCQFSSPAEVEQAIAVFNGFDLCGSKLQVDHWK